MLRRLECLLQHGEGAPDVTPQRHVDRVELAERHAIRVDLDRLHVGRDAGVVRKGRAEHELHVAARHQAGGGRRSAASEHATGERVVVGDEALRLERRDDRRVDVLGERDDGVAERPCAVPADDRRSLGLAQELDRPGELVRGRQDRGARDAPGSRPCGRLVEAVELLHLVREDQVGDVAVDDRVLHRERRELARVRRREHGLAPLGDRRERLAQRDLLEGAWSEDLGLHLSGQREDRRAVDLRVPQTGQQVRRTRPRDREASGRATRELRVAARGERPGALVADADVAEPPIDLRAPERISHAEVRVADHAEHGVDAPLAEHVDDLVHQRDARLDHGQLDVDAVLALVDGVGRRGVAVSRRWRAAPGVVLVAVPGADDEAVLELPIAERTALVRAAVVEHAVAGLRARDAEGASAGDHRREPADVELRVAEAHPLARLIVCHSQLPLTCSRADWKNSRPATTGSALPASCS